MDATCSRCGPAVRALIAYRNGALTLEFCGHHAREHHDALTAQGFTRHALALPDVRDASPSPVAG